MPLHRGILEESSCLEDIAVSDKCMFAIPSKVSMVENSGLRCLDLDGILLWERATRVEGVDFVLHLLRKNYKLEYLGEDFEHSSLYTPLMGII
jgi:hypothetical protein